MARDAHAASVMSAAAMTMALTGLPVCASSPVVVDALTLTNPALASVSALSAASTCACVADSSAATFFASASAAANTFHEAAV